MTSPPIAIYDVDMHKYAYSSTGELGSKGLSPCVAVIIVFSNRTVMIEHRSESELCDKGDQFDATDLFLDIVDNVKAMEKQNLNIHWSIEDKHEYNLNEQFIDALIAHEKSGSFHFFVRQYVHLVDNITKQKTAICCGYLRYKLFDDNDANVQQGSLSLAGAEFYVDNDIAEQHKQGAVPIKTDAIDFINSINNMFNRMVKSPQKDVVIKDFE
ncbi:unnamed protein product [Didymodactylos carnosus]|uniref:Uncharacterized protein n=1 Tax=Didymodactylos carnosus TaxID=1234261 RepID=A0A814SI87_9BILA|nr:unnamed protein product [Didymodactylos carnosus]CAF3911346.1 unnamed protein product [Didymodactylos carnosus]